MGLPLNCLPRLLLPLLVVALVSCGGEGRNVPDLQAFAPDSVGGWTADTIADTYDRESIFTYINGAGEVYLSYGFGRVDVLTYRRQDHEPIVLEVFDMGSSEDAYGVFSFARESEDSGIGRAYEYRGGLLSFWQDRFFVCVSSKRPGADIEAVMRALASAVAGFMPDRSGPPGILQLLPEASMADGSPRFFHKHASLNYYYYLAEDNLLGLDSATSAVLAEYQPGLTYLLVVRYPSVDHAVDALASFTAEYAPETASGAAVAIEEDKWTQTKQWGEYLGVVLDAPTPGRAAELLDSVSMRIENQREGR